MCKARGAIVHIISSSDQKLERAKQLGADFTTNYRTTPNWAQNIFADADGHGVDIVVETGGPLTLPQSIAACRIGGTIVLVGVLTGIAGTVPTVQLMSKQIRLQGITVGSRADQIAMVHALDQYDFRPVLYSDVPFAEAQAAFELYESGKYFGKIGMTY